MLSFVANAVLSEPLRLDMQVKHHRLKGTLTQHRLQISFKYLTMCSLYVVNKSYLNSNSSCEGIVQEGLLML